MQPWYRFYSGDFLLDSKVRALPLEAQGILVRLWCICHRDGGFPSDYLLVARLASVNPKMLKKHWPALIGGSSSP